MPEEMVTITTPTCIMCGQKGAVTVRRDQLEAYEKGAFAQVAFPTLSAGDREMLITGTHSDCFDELFPEED